MTALLSSPSTWVALAVLAALAALAAVVNHRLLRLSPTVGAMAVSLAASLALAGLAALGVDGGLLAGERALLARVDFPTLVLQGLLSMLLFAGALQVDVGALREQRLPVLGFAVAGTAGSTALVGVGLFFVLRALSLDVPIGHCLVFGALVSPTDPVAVIAMLRSARAPRALEAVIAGESLFNDGV
ncbi:MAG TPA: cation:proton antiporter, partial [Burkholderiaceae bacterium]